MSKNLIIVESPAKSKTIEKFLGKNYSVVACMGHLRDLPKSQFGVDLENQYQPKYINIRNKSALIKELKNQAKKADKIYLATDPDREGEAIAWHLAFILGVDPNDSCRIVFNEITKNAVQDAIKKPRKIDYSMVDAQQTRRILDRIVGYKLSPLLWRKIRKGLSAGRVQSVAVKIICDREKQIQSFIPQEYWSIFVELKENQKDKAFSAELVKNNGTKISINDEKQAKNFEKLLNKAQYVVDKVVFKERIRKPFAPYTTSSMQQDAVRKLGLTTKKTMMLAQQLYEGVGIGDGYVGLITYMRTDSVRIAESAQTDARDYIKSSFGTKYLPTKPPVYTTKAASQDAHEAIRPSDVLKTPDNMKQYLSRDQLKLYKMIWQRFVTSQMAPAVFDTTTIDIKADKLGLRASGSIVKFDGFLTVYDKKDDENELQVKVPALKEGSELILDKVLPPEQHFTQPSPRFNEASLVKYLEEHGIGRPSTYAPTINTILERGYIEKEDKKLLPTELGKLVVEMLEDHFQDIVDTGFSAKMEAELDDIAEGQADKTKILDDFYLPFAKVLAQAEDKIGVVEIQPEISDVKCEKCERFMVIKHGRFGDFLACPGFPDCRNAKPILKKIGVSCPVCSSEIVERKSKRGKKFYGCEKYPECSFVAWDKPTDKKCEKCGDILVEKYAKNGSAYLACTSEKCKDGKENVAKTKTTKPRKPRVKKS